MRDTGDEVEPRDIIKGYQVGKGEYRASTLKSWKPLL